jgi:hypothetical protein
MNDQSDSQKGKTAPLDFSKALPFLNKETAIVPGGANRIRKMLEDAGVGNSQTLVVDPQSVVLVARGIKESVPFDAERMEFILGRNDHLSAVRPDIDLSPLGAAERGVSRRHARLALKEHQLYVTDLESSNGTILRGERLRPYSPVVVQRGDELILGRLALQILFD